MKMIFFCGYTVQVIRWMDKMSPNALPNFSGQFRFFFYAREEDRMHVHVLLRGKGQAKIWLEPKIELANNNGLSHTELRKATQLVMEYQDEIRTKWKEYFKKT